MELPIQLCALITRPDSVIFHRIFRNQCVEFQFVFVLVCINKMYPRNKRLGTRTLQCHLTMLSKTDRIYEMSSSQIFNGFYTIIRKSQQSQK